MSAAREEALTPEAVADFLREVRGGVEDGLDPLAAAREALGSLPGRLRSAIELIVRRLEGDYHEDEWGFDEELRRGGLSRCSSSSTTPGGGCRSRASATFPPTAGG